MDLWHFLQAINRIRPELLKNNVDMYTDVLPHNRQSFLTVLRLGYTIQEAYETSLKYNSSQIENYFDEHKKLIK